MNSSTIIFNIILGSLNLLLIIFSGFYIYFFVYKKINKYMHNIKRFKEFYITNFDSLVLPTKKIVKSNLKNISFYLNFSYFFIIFTILITFFVYFYQKGNTYKDIYFENIWYEFLIIFLIILFFNLYIFLYFIKIWSSIKFEIDDKSIIENFKNLKINNNIKIEKIKLNTNINSDLEMFFNFNSWYFELLQSHNEKMMIFTKKYWKKNYNHKIYELFYKNLFYGMLYIEKYVDHSEQEEWKNALINNFMIDLKNSEETETFSYF